MNNSILIGSIIYYTFRNVNTNFPQSFSTFSTLQKCCHSAAGDRVTEKSKKFAYFIGKPLLSTDEVPCDLL